MRYFVIFNTETLEVIGTEFETQPENSLPFENHNFKKACFDQYPNPTAVVEGWTEVDENNALREQLALHVAYPELQGMNYKLLQLDNLEGIRRDSTLADKGLKGEKKYKKDNLLIWSTEKKYWFQEDGYEGGFRRVVKLFNMLGEVADSWEIIYELSEDDKELFKKQQREMIFEYFKSQQPQLFNLLYAFFKDEIDRYVMKDGEELAAVLTDAAVNHPVEIVRQTLTMEVPTQSGGTVTVLQGILAELV
jgi:hypothetical protein